MFYKDDGRSPDEIVLELYRAAANAAGLAFWDVDIIDGDIYNLYNKVNWSAEFRKMLGFNNEFDFPSVLTSVTSRIHPGDKEKTYLSIERYLADVNDSANCDIEFRLLLSSGIYKYFRFCAIALRDSSGIPYKFAGTLIDINERKKADNDLWLMSSIVHNSPDFISYRKLDGECLYINPAATNITGYSHAELKENYLSKFFNEKASENTAEVHKEMSEKGVASFEYAGITKDGNTKYLKGTSFLIEEDAFVSIASDFTETREMMEDIEKNNILLRSVNQVASLLLSAGEKSNITSQFKACLEIVGRSLDADRIHIWQCMDIEDEVQLIHIYGWINESCKSTARIPQMLSISHDGITNWKDIFLRGEIIHGPVSKMPENNREYFKSFNIDSVVIVPIFYDNSFWGLFSVDICYRERHFTQEEIDIMGAVSLMIVNAISRNELIEKRTHDLAVQSATLKETERVTALKYNRAVILKESLAVITNSQSISAGDLKATAEVIVKECCHALNISNAGLWLLDKSNDNLVNFTSYNIETGEYCADKEFDLKKHPMYKELLESERLIIIEDSNRSRYDLIAGDYGLNFSAVLEAPIRVGNDLTGVICAEQYKNEEYPEMREWAIEEQNYLSSLSDLMALAFAGSELREAQEMAETANKAKSSFLANMSHEIRTPMNTILGVVDIMMQKGDHSKEVEEGLERIHSSCNLLLGIINDILDFSKIEAGKLNVENAQYKVADLISDTVQLYMIQTDSKPIEFEVLVDENVPSKLIGDELRIKQILGNLLSNAFKYTESGKITLTIVCQQWATNDGVTLIMVVRDTGCGISKERLGDLFIEYSRIANKKINVEGTGLGLTIARSLINLMNGGISVESEPGVGSVFVVKLPQKKVDDEVLGCDTVERLKEFRLNCISRSGRSQITRDYMPYGSVLVVDDVEANLYVANGLIKPYGVKIITVMSGQEAIDLVREGNVYDIIFMDHMMPDMDGMETTGILRDMGYSGTIIALTANAVVGQAEIFLQNGFDEFISKPIDIRQLNAVLNKHIRDKQSAEVLKKAQREKESHEVYVIDGHVMDINYISDNYKMIDPDVQSDGSGAGLLGMKVDGIDLIKGLQRYGGDGDTYLRILRAYIGSVRTILTEISDVKKDELADYRIKVHGIKGASFDVFAEKTGNAAKALENAASKGDYDHINAHNAGFIEDANRFIGDLELMISNIEISDPKPSKNKPDPELLSRLKVACNKYDLNESEAIMDELEAWQYKVGSDLIKWLRDNVDIMNFTGIAEKLSKNEV